MSLKRPRETSALQVEDTAFPRGGAVSTVLTPLEIKQARKEGEELFNTESSSASGATKHKKAKKGRKSATGIFKKTENDDLLITPFNFQKLLPGSFVLGQVQGVSALEIILSLPNNLVGYIPATNVCKTISDRIEQANDEDVDEDEQDIDLTNLFSAGQWLRCEIVEQERSSNTQKIRLELSIDPQNVNRTISKEDIKEGASVQGSIKSVEDHGVIVDLGLDDISGFISHKELTFEDQTFKVGQVALFSVLKCNGRTATLTCSAHPRKMGLLEKVTSIKSLAPGTLVEARAFISNSNGLICEVMGNIQCTVDLVHTGIVTRGDLASKFPMGTKLKGRILFQPQSLDDDRYALTLLPAAVNYASGAAQQDAEAFSIGQIIEATVAAVDRQTGIFVDMGIKAPGFVPLSKISDERVDNIDVDAKLKKGTRHRVRVIGYSGVDGLYYLTMQASMLDRDYLSISDIPVGAIVEGKIEKRLPTNAFLVTLWEGCQGFVHDTQLSDVKLPFPERKFKNGAKVKCRVLEVDPSRNRLRLTLKKSLIESRDPIISSYEIEPGTTSLGTLTSVKANGAVVEFSNGVRGYLPASEMSESFVANATEMFSAGQTVKVRVINSQPDKEKMRVSCRLAQLLPENIKVFDELEEGTIVKATVAEKFKDTIVVELSQNSDESSLLATIEPGHLSDDLTKISEVARQYSVGDTIEVAILCKHVARKAVTVTAKPSLIKDVKNKKLPFSFHDVKKAQKLHGYISAVKDLGVFVTFGGEVTALVLAHELTIPKETLMANQSVEVVVRKVDEEDQRIFVIPTNIGGGLRSADPFSIEGANGMLVPGTAVKAEITAVKPTHLDVSINGTHGRVDISLACPESEIVDVRRVTSQFERGQMVEGRVISTENGVQISLRTDEENMPSMADAKIGSEWTAYVVSTKDDFLFVNVSPQLRGRMSLLDAGKTLQGCPVGSALRCRVVAIDEKNSGAYFRCVDNISISQFSDVKVGDVVPAMVIRPYSMYVLVRLGAEIVASAFATDALDKFSPLEEAFQPLERVTAKVTAIESHKHRIYVSLRDTDISEEPLAEDADKSICKSSEVSVGDIVRGYVSNVSNGGVFVALGRTITGRVQIKEISDTYVREWKQFFSVGQVIKAKVIAKTDNDRVELSIRPSLVGESAVPQLEVGAIRAGTVDRIEEYGVFVKLESGESGLCHVSEVADTPVKNLSKMFSVGDPVKVKVLSINAAKRRIALGMKASYFGEEEESDAMEEDEAEQEESGSEMDVDQDEEDSDLGDLADHISVASSDEEDEEKDEGGAGQKPLSVGFDWTTSILDQLGNDEDDAEDSDEDSDDDDSQKIRRRKKTQITQDKTGTLNTKLPQSVADFERLIVGTPNSSVLWINYMAFQLQLSEIDKAREIGKRALDTINFREEQEKQNVWIALLNLENSFGTEQTLEDTFKDAVQYMDSNTMHLKLANIYAQSGKVDQAIRTYRTTVKKFGTNDSSLWVTFARYLMEQERATDVHALLDQALKTLPKRDHRDIISKFAQLEYSKGDIERGRTLFEGLVSAFARRVDLWNVYIDQEIKAQQRDAAEKLFERVIAGKLSMKQAKFFFKKWLTFEDKYGDEKSIDYVKSKAAEYVAARQKTEGEDEEEDENEVDN